VARRYFGTDGVRGIVGEFLTPELVEKLGRASALWSRAERVFVGRDTRGSGPELEQALARGVSSAGATALLGGVLPTPAVALAAEDLGVVISASHNPPEYNGVKFFDRDGQKLVDAQEEEIEALLEPDPTSTVLRGGVERVERSAERYIEYVLEHFGADLTGMRIAVDCANGAYSEIAPHALERLGAEIATVCCKPDGANINAGCGATDLSLLRDTVRRGKFDLGVAFDGDGDRMLAVDAQGHEVDGDQIVAILALHLGVDLVAVTSMTNLGFHALMRERGIRVVTTDVGDRYVLEALRREGGVLGGEQSGHIVYLRDHVTGDGLVGALLLCDAVRGRTLAEAAAVMPRYPQVKHNVRVELREIAPVVAAEVARLNAALGGRGRILVRPSGTEPLIRVLAEAETEDEAARLCSTIAGLVEQQLG
jgi:phosphoglucosamine mutase